jgi:peptidoglycan/xylan/chitin deacetylase (PgdA/CDA1 family)
MSRESLKSALARLGRGARPAPGMTALIYHRVGGGSPDERDLPLAAFAQQVNAIATAVEPIDVAIDRLEAGDRTPTVVLTFDDGFADVHRNAWPLLRERELPFIVYVATAYVGGEMRWEGSTAKEAAPGLTWDQLGEMVASGLCTIGNHTHTHARPELLSVDELDRCNDQLERRVGVRPQHFAYPWGIAVDGMVVQVRSRFRTAATGTLGRNLPGCDLQRLRRVPVRRSDPIDFFRAKLSGSLVPERTYASVVWAAKKLGVNA